jgi:threonine/homoserine efflux transporter RhtA
MKPPQPIGQFEEVKGIWFLAEPWRCRLGDGRWLMVHPGAESDGASIPRALWPLVGPRYHATTFPAAFAHDMLYAAELVSRQQADNEFRALLVKFGVSAVKAKLYYWAVRRFGWCVWMRHTKDSIAAARMFAEVQP